MDSRILPVGSGLYFSPLNTEDIPALVLHLNDKDIYDNTLMIPYPYTEDAGKWFIGFCDHLYKQFGHDLNLALRNSEGNLIGVCGFHGKNSFPAIAHKDEIGYWIARDWRGKGIMTKAVSAMVEYGIRVRGLSRFEAPVYADNIASQKLLHKCGFREEGFMPKAYYKNGIFRDGKLFALVR